MSATVRAGYKQTEVGVIPEDWEVKPVKEFAVVKGGKRLPLGKSVMDKVTAHPYLRVTDMLPGGVDLNDIKYVPEEVFPFIKNYRITTEDIFISVAGTLGIVGKIPPVLNGANLTENADKITSITCDRDFLLHNLMSDRVQDIIESEKTVGAQPKLAISRIENFTIALPPVHAEQRAIANALSDVDALLAKLDALIAKKRDLKVAAMQQLLTGQTRLPGFSGEWEVKRLGDITECLDNVRVPLNESERNQMRGDYPYCGANGVLDFVNDYVLDDDVILMAEDGGYFDEYAYRPIAYRMIGKCWINNHAHILKAKAGYDQGLLFYLLVHKNIQSYLASGTRAKLNKSEMNKIEVNLSLDLLEQTAIATILSDMDTELTALEARRDKTRALKQGMMQELLTGRIRLVSTSPQP